MLRKIKLSKHKNFKWQKFSVDKKASEKNDL